MRSTELSALIDTYGAALERWPMAQRTRAAALLEASESARSLLAQAQAIECGLRRPPAGCDAVTAERLERIAAMVAAKAKTMPQDRPGPGLRPIAWLGAFAAEIGSGWLRFSMPMAAGAVLGILVGHYSVDPVVPPVAPQGTSFVSLLEMFYTSGLFQS